MTLPPCPYSPEAFLFLKIRNKAPTRKRTKMAIPLMTPITMAGDGKGSKTANANSCPRLPRPSPEQTCLSGDHLYNRRSLPCMSILTPGDSEGPVEAWMVHLTGEPCLVPRGHGHGHLALIGAIPIRQHILGVDGHGIQWLAVLQPPHSDILGGEVQSPAP